MKKNSIVKSFTDPTRQSWVAIILIIFKTYKIIISQLWPILFLLFFKKKGGLGNQYILIGVVSFALLAMVYSIVNYFRYYFYVEEEELVIESGVFRRKKMNVPFERIQTINFEQSIIHRIFNVVRLKIDTAGSSKSEFNFHALSHERAEVLRDFILAKKKSIQRSNINFSSQEVDKKQSTYNKILHLDFVDLLKAGLVENHIRSGWIIVGVMFYIWSNLRDINLEETFEKGVYDYIMSGTFLIVFSVIVFLVLSFLVSLVRMVVRNYDLSFMRSDKGFKINAGLFTKRDTSAMDHKIQLISWADNPLKKLIGIKDLSLKQASSVSVNHKSSIKIPSCTDKHINQVKQSLYGDKALREISYYPIDRRYFTRNAFIISMLTAGVSGCMFYFNTAHIGWIVLGLGLFLVLNFYLAYRKKRYGYNDEMLVIRAGAFGDKEILMPIYKIQTIKKEQTPYQRRKHLATLQFSTASGNVYIPYIEESTAQSLMDLFLFKVENDRRKWM